VNLRSRVVAGLIAGATLALALLTAGPAAAAGTGLPTDTRASGWIGLCDEAGHNVTGGDIHAKPFVWKAVASQAPPAAYRGTGQNTALSAFQPRPQVPAEEWSGTSMTAASYYSTPTHPAAQATYADLSVADLLRQYPAEDNGLIVLRMFFGRANYGIYQDTYPTTTIQVVGSRWHVVAGGTVDCGGAEAVSSEQLTGAVTAKEFTPHRAASGAAPAGPAGAGSGSAGSSSSGSVSPGSSAGSSAAGSSGSGAPAGSSTVPDASAPHAYTGHLENAAATHQDGRTVTPTVVLAIVAGLLVAVIAALLVRRRRPTSGSPST
jgi:hypothetical protein